MLAGAALAACLAIVVFINTPSRREGGSKSATTNGVAPTSNQHFIPQVGMDSGANHLAGLRPSDVGVFNVRDLTPQPIKRTTDRNMIVLPGQDGRLYLINLDHTRQVQQSNAAVGEMSDPV
jgi:hypothetical protein